MPTATELAVVQTSDATLLADTIFGDGVTVVSASLTGNAVQSGIYSGADATVGDVAPSDSGVIFSTGNTGDITNSSGTSDTNTTDNTGTGLAGAGDDDLTALGGNATEDAIVFEAEFIPTGDFLTMQFTFSSEEYLEYVNQGVNDVFGVWVNGTFVELTPAGDTVSIDTVNQGVNSNLYVDNDAALDTYNTEMDGFTVTLSMKAPVLSGQVNTIKIGLADGGDDIYDSNVMIAANSAQTITLAMADEFTIAQNTTRIIDILQNDTDIAGGGLTVTEINSQAIAVGETVVLGTGEQITLNSDGTITVLTDDDITTSTLSYTVMDVNGVTDVGFITINTAAVPGPDGIVDGTLGNDVIDAVYAGDPDGDFVDNNDALGVQGTTGDGDVINGFGGNDTIRAGAGDDIVYAGADDDSVEGGAGNDTIFGGNGEDSLDGGSGDDSIDGGTGNDTITGLGGQDTIDGGDGDDLIAGDATNPAAAPSSGDAGQLFLDVINVQPGSETGTPGDAQVGDSVIFQNAGTLPDGTVIMVKVTVASVTDPDVTIDLTQNQAGAPLRVNGNGDATNAGELVEFQLDFFDQATGLPIVIDGQATVTDIDDNPGAGTEFVSFAQGDVTTYTLDASTSLLAATSGDAVSATGTVTNNADDEEAWFGVGFESQSSLSFTVGVVENTANYGFSGSDLQNGVTTPVEGGADDSLSGGAGNDIIFGNGGNDEIDGGADDDTLYGGAGQDSLTGGTGADTIIGGADQDSIYGGSGDVIDGSEDGVDNDTLFVTGVTDVTYDAGNVENGFVTFLDGETATFTNIENVVVVADGTVSGTAGNDVIDAAYTGDFDGDRVDNNDAILAGDTGDDDLIEAGAGNDTVLAGNGNDEVYGGDGDDTIIGGSGPSYSASTPFSSDFNNIATDPGVTTSGGSIGTGAFGNPAQFQFVGPSYIVADPDEGGADVGDVDSISISFSHDVGSGNGQGLAVSFGDPATIPSNPIEPLTTGLSVVMDVTTEDMVFYWDGVEIGREPTPGYGIESFGTSNTNLTISDTGAVTLSLSNAPNDYTAQIPGDAWQESDTSDFAFVAGMNPNGTNGNNRITNIEFNGTTHVLDSITGTGDDTLFGGIGADTIDGQDGDDTIYGGAGSDTLTGGIGADTMFGGTDDDIINFSEGDTASGGTGDDLFVLEDLGEPSNGTITIDGGAGDETGGDTLQLGDLGVLTQAVRDTFVDDGTGSFTGSVTLDDGTILNFSEIENIICFTPGTRIATPQGLVAVEDLKVGDLVVTRDHGLQPIRWVEARTVPAVDSFAPVRIGKNVLSGQQRDLIVSPQHRVLFSGYRAELLFGDSEVLVSAKHLIDGLDVTQDAGDTVTYVHMLFDQHEIIFAEGAATESFHPGDIGFSAVTDKAREELFAIFPELRVDPRHYGNTARRCLKSHEARMIRM